MHHLTIVASSATRRPPRRYRFALSVVYGIDLAIRGVLAGHPVRYATARPLALAAVLFRRSG
jgi:hypothetical protein